jgi:hypothetical protein
MASRIITKGLKTGTGVGGVKYILRRGLISAAAPVISILENTISFDLFIDQQKDFQLFIDQQKNFDLEF